MFDIGFAELLLVCIVGIVILGPQRLPQALKTAALYWGRLQRSFQHIKQDLEQEVGLDEVRQQLAHEKLSSIVDNTKSQLQDIDDQLHEESFDDWYRDYEQSIDERALEEKKAKEADNCDQPQNQ